MADLIDPTGGAQADDPPKIIVDSDWKAEAQAEKERLAEQEQVAADGAAAGDPLEADFRALLGSLATQAMMYLGAFPDQDGRAVVAPEYARHYIDLLGVLDEKTKGNLSDEESKELTSVLHELRARFVQIVQGVAAAGKEPGGEGMAPVPPENPPTGA
jgi:Domain of unknown function (DUF1844)